MCIRDRPVSHWLWPQSDVPQQRRRHIRRRLETERNRRSKICLLYTSDAADERSSVDLGGRRIIKKKTITSITCNSTIKRSYSWSTACIGSRCSTESSIYISSRWITSKCSCSTNCCENRRSKIACPCYNC